MIFAVHTLEGEPRAGRFVTGWVDRILLNDISGPLAFRKMQEMGAQRVAHPDRVVLVNDHFVPPKDLPSAINFTLMRRFAVEQGIEHCYDFNVGGIEHALLPEHGLVAPGHFIAGGDSHTCTYGAFAALGTGLGSTDMAALLAVGELWFMVPQTIRHDFVGHRQRFVTGKDPILHIVGRWGVDGAAYRCMEFGGPALADFNIDERMALCNMAVEAGAKTCIVEPDEVTRAWARSAQGLPSRENVSDRDALFAARHTIDLSAFGPLVAAPHSPGNVKPLAEVAGTRVDQVYVGNCSNGTMTDLRQVAEVVRGKRIARHVRAIIVPATQAIYRQALAEGLLQIFAEAGMTISTPTCGACFGGHMGLLDRGEVAVATTNRNFRGRMGHPEAQVYLANAYVAAAAAVAGEIVPPESALAGAAWTGRGGQR